MTEDKITSFTKLVAWQQSHKLVIAVFKTCGALRRNDSLWNQMERSAVSITSNIAEGFGRQSTQDKRHFYIMARGSGYELQSVAYCSRHQEDIAKRISRYSTNIPRFNSFTSRTNTLTYEAAKC